MTDAIDQDKVTPPQEVPDAIAAQYVTQQLIAVIKAPTQQHDALWSACLLELATRCQDPAVAQLVVDEQVPKSCGLACA